MNEPRIRVAIGVITRRRDQSLRRLLESYAALKIPTEVSPVFIVVENDTELKSKGVVGEFAAKVQQPVIYELENEPGIPFARNRVLRIALAQDCDFLTFTDDDQAVPVEWLEQLLTSITQRGFDLVGGPLSYEVDCDHDRLSLIQKAVLRNTRARANKGYAKRTSYVGTEIEGTLGIYTNNWVGRLSTIRELDIWFDENLRFCGGSDTKFYQDMRDAGAKTGWAPEAYATEFRPLKRLSLWSHYARVRDQEAARRLRNGQTGRCCSAIALFVVAAIVTIVLFLIAPFKKMYPAAQAARLMGRIVGRLKASFGVGSKLYALERLD